MEDGRSNHLGLSSKIIRELRDKNLLTEVLTLCEHDVKNANSIAADALSKAPKPSTTRKLSLEAIWNHNNKLPYRMRALNHTDSEVYLSLKRKAP